MMNIGNKAAYAIIAKHGYAFFCEFRRCRHGGWGMQKAMFNAMTDKHRTWINNNEDEE